MDATCVEVIELQKDFKSLTAKEDIPKGALIGDFRGQVYQEKNRHTVQIGAHTHIESEGGVTYTNHSCSPNAQMVYHARPGITNDKEGFTVAWHMIACRDIKKGEAITFDYTTTEYSMAEPFDCMCKS